MIGLIVILLLLVLLLFTKAGLWLRWDSAETKLRIRIGIFRISLAPKGKGKQKKTGIKKQQPTATKKNSALKKWLKAALTHRAELLNLLERMVGLPQLDLLCLHIAVGGVEPDECALSYGRICAGLSAGLPAVTNIIKVKKQDIDVQCRFDLSQTQFLVEAEATARIYEILFLFWAGLRVLLKLYYYVKKSDKAV